MWVKVGWEKLREESGKKRVGGGRLGRVSLGLRWVGGWDVG